MKYKHSAERDALITQLVHEGKNNREIAAVACITQRTVSHHKTRLGLSQNVTIQWTPEMDETLKALRLAGNSYDTIARTMSISKGVVRERLLKLNVRIRRVEPCNKPAPLDRVQAQLVREPLPAGHPDTWGILTDAKFPK